MTSLLQPLVTRLHRCGNSIRNMPLSRSLVVLGVVVLIAMVAGSTRQVIVTRRMQLQEAETQVAKLDMVFAEQTGRAVEGVDLVLRNSIETFRALSGVNRAEPAIVNAMLKERIEGVRQVAQILIADKTGTIAFSAKPLPLPGISVASQPFFRSLAENPRLGLQFSEPIRDESGHWQIFLARRIDDDQGGFLGIAIAFLDPLYFEDFYRAVGLGDGSVIMLHRRDGIVLARHPHDDAVIGKSYAHLAPFTDILSHAMAGTVIMTSPIDGSRRVLAVRALKLFPLVVNVSLDESIVLQRWRNQMRWFVAAAVASGLFIIVLIVLLARQSRRQETLTRELESAKDSAERASKVKSEFLANMSHELRTPLNAIIGFSEIMANQAYGPMNNPDYVKFSDHILRSGQHLLALINDVLDMSKIEAKRFQLLEEDFPLRDAIDDVLSLVQLQAGAKSIVVALDANLPAVTLKADRRAVRQILLNLLSNAIKFTPEKGNVRIAGDVEPTGALAIAISDNGIGIPSQSLERIFAPFEQASTKLTRQSEGTGLGLAITRGLMELHGGAIRIDSMEGKGTTVTLTFPPERVSSNGAPARG